ncbi:hypothetical protein SADUNF_Sadunf09G0115100 [Salix dunnii]|uniref:Uncharacterized protein n=1 Tax=Salix dunnii TaxID=1413687 RepID=A0A835JTI9_9ROSI|nr:hypothetical protein SADUNF_Sadunf09G0115100 [Salix dunnii]
MTLGTLCHREVGALMVTILTFPFKQEDGVDIWLGSSWILLSRQGRAGKEADVYSFRLSEFGSFSGAGNVFEVADERLDMDFSKHEMDFNKCEHPIAKQRPKISQAIENSCVMDSDDVDSKKEEKDS